ncbi:MinD/ParA family protein [Pseudomonadota bacterium]
MNAPLPQQKPSSVQKNTAHVIAISSGKGGVGKTNIATNLGITLASSGKKVCIFDADTNLANINILLNINPPHTLQQVLNGEKKIEEILVNGPAGLQIVPAASGIAEFIELDRTQQERLLSALKQLESHFDYLLIDTAAGISNPVLHFLQAAPYRILIITPEPTSLTDAFSLIKVLKQRGLEQPFFTIVNMATSAADASAVYRRFKSAVAKYLQQHVRLLGYVLSDAELTRSVIQQQAVVTRAPSAIASRCILNLSNRLEQYLESDKSNASFSAFWDEQLTPVSQSESNLQTVQSDSRYATTIEDVKRYLQQCNTEEAEALLLQLTQSWIERFGSVPPTLLNETKEQCSAVATKEVLASTPAELSQDLAGLQQAIHYAQLLSKTEAEFS